MNCVDRNSIPRGKHLLKFVISHISGSHIQGSGDLVKAVYKPPICSYRELNLTFHEEAEEAIVVEEGADLNELQKSVVSEYRRKTGYYNPLKISQVCVKGTSNGEENEMLKIKVVQITSNTDEILEGILDSNLDTHCLSRFPVHPLPLCELPSDGGPTGSLKVGEREENGGILLETYSDNNREMFSVKFGEDDIMSVSRSAVDKFHKISGITDSLSAQRERIFTYVNNKEVPITIMYLFPDPEVKKTETCILVKETARKRGRPRGRRKGVAKGRIMKEVRELNEYVSQFKHSKFRRRDNGIPDQDKDLQIALEEEISDMEGDDLSTFGCETGIVVSGSVVSSSADSNDGDGAAKEDLPMLELQSSHEDMNASLNPGDIWKFLTQYASEDNRVQGLVTQFNNESWLQVKRMSNFYQIDGEVMTDLSFKVVYRNDFSPITYFLRGFSRLLKTGELNTANDINNLFRFMSRDRKLCLGLKPSPYQHSIDSNTRVRKFFQEKGQFLSTPFECLLSKSCRGIVKIIGTSPVSVFTRGSRTVHGVHALCRACALLGKKMNQLIKLSPKNSIMEADEMQEKVVGDSFLQLLRQPVKRSGMTYSALKYLFTQSIPEILSDKELKSSQTFPDEADIDEETQTGAKRGRGNQKEGKSKSNICVTEEAFLQMIDLQPPNSEGLGRSLLKKCNLCQFRAPTMLSLVTHMKGHLGTLKEKCSQCEIQLSSKEALEIHKKQMHMERSPVCSICEMDFTTNDQLFDHMNKHRNHLPFECPYCNHKLSNKEAYKKHLRLTHKITSVKDLKFNCKTCNIFFYTEDHVLLHRVNQNHEGIEPFNCRACAFSCVTANEFRHHIMEHAEEEREAVNLAICPECYKVFFSKYRLTFHIEMKHSKVKAKSDQLPEAIVESESVPTVKKKKSKGPYLRYLRANEKYECAKCKRRFKTAKTLESHIKFAHAEKKACKSEHVCTLCGRKFNALRRLGNHMKIHSGNRPVFQCEECGQIYGKKTQVLEHIRTDHAEQVERHQQQQELVQVDQSQDQQFVDIQVHQQNNCSIEGSASTSWSPIKSPFKVPTVEQTQEAVYSLLQLTDF
ncbi:uncharacterized protein LOC135215475 [Macrobrachium nipponense]|uniref:uncharacterized protein LOC135215475 n=1 Tax=Macrobrachium nipponense TaxID=159736 RepID=UPI0030C7B207